MKKHFKQRLALAALPMAVLASLAAPSVAMADDVEYHGYVRTAVGQTAGGGNLQCFDGPWPIRGKFRLGNECDSYGEAFIGLGFGDLNGAWAKYNLGLAYQPKDKQSFDSVSGGNLDFAATENYFQGGGFFESDALKSAKVWVGKRYLRKDIHITDYYYWNISGSGAGIEEIAAGKDAKFAVSYLQGGGNSTAADAVVPKWLAAKISDIPVNVGGKLEVEAVLMQGSKAQGSAAIGNGTQLLVQHKQAGVLGGDNTLALVFGSGAGGSGFEWLPAYWGGTENKGDDGSSVNLHDYVNFKSDNGKWSGQAVLSYGSARGNAVSYVGVGVRPVYHFSNTTSLAVEVSHQEGKNGNSKPTLDKVTIAPQFTLSKGFYARPVFRAFVTHARWNDDAGNVANGAFGNNARSGTTVGFQAEAWW